MKRYIKKIILPITHHYPLLLYFKSFITHKLKFLTDAFIIILNKKDSQVCSINNLENRKAQDPLFIACALLHLSREN